MSLNKTATDEPYGFLYIKLTAKSKEDMFFKNLSTKLSIKEYFFIDTIYRKIIMTTLTNSEGYIHNYINEQLEVILVCLNAGNTYYYRRLRR